MKKIWSKKRFQKTVHSNRTFGRFAHVFRSCRKQSYDSENTEDETAESQVPLEIKQRGKGPDRDGCSSKIGAHGPHMYGQSDLRLGQDPVVERDILTLGSIPLRPQDSSQMDRSQVDSIILRNTPPLTEGQSGSPTTSSPLSLTLSSTIRPDLSAPHSSLQKDSDKQKLHDGNIKIQSTVSCITSGSQDSITCQTKPVRSGSKIFDKIRVFEERRHSVDVPRASLEWSRTDFSHETESLKGVIKDVTISDVAKRRSFFKQRASSLEDQPSYSQKVQSFQSKFTEELHRLKKLVGRKSTSTEQISETDEGSPNKSKTMFLVNTKEKGTGKENVELSKEHQASKICQKKQKNHGIVSEVMGENAKPPTPPGVQISLSTGKSPTSVACTPFSLQKPQDVSIPGKDRNSVCPLLQRASEEGTIKPASKVPQLVSITSQHVTTLQSGKEQKPAMDSKVTLKLNIPAITVEDEPMEEEEKSKRDQRENSQGENMGRPQRTRDTCYFNHQESPKQADDSKVLVEEGAVEPPRFECPLEDMVASMCSEVVLTCVITGRPNPQVIWRKGEIPIRDGLTCVVEREAARYSLIIQQMRPSDAGTYHITAVNSAGQAGSSATLFISTAPMCELDITHGLQDISVKAGETAIFECHVVGPLEMDVDWLANGKVIQPALLDCKMHFDGTKCRLLLRSVHEDDSGTYTCKLSSSTEELKSSGKLWVSPSKKPLFTRKLDVLEITEGRAARFNCKVSGSPSPTVTWTHYDHTVEESENITVMKEGGHHSLLISHVTQGSKGLYTVTAQNIHGEVKSAAELYVQETRPSISSHMAKLEKMPSIPEEPEVLEMEMERRTMPDFINPLSDMEVIEGKEAVLKCKVAGMPYPTISWYHNGKKLDSTDDRKITQYRNVHSLVVRTVCQGHSGVYKCVISNKVGKATCYAHLCVADVVPEALDSPPVIEAITGRTISLSWTRPRNLDSSIDPSSLMYAIQQQTLGSIQWTFVASSLRETSYTIFSLSKGVRYSFRVLTSTGKAFSKPSPSTDLVQLIDKGKYLFAAPVILDKPDMVYVVENQPVSINITLNHVNATIKWKKRGLLLVSKPGVCEMSMPDDDQHMLRLNRVKNSDVGQLSCTASNQFGSDHCTIQLTLAAPPTFETIMEDLDVCVGETLRFAVVVDGKPDPDILWYKDNTQLSESNHFMFVYDDRECSLVILNAWPEDSGVYTCTVKNLAGAVSCKAELTVHTVKHIIEEPIEGEESILRKMRRLTDYYDIHKEIGRGAFSYVKRVTMKSAKKDYAAKFISARGKKKASALREMTLLSDLDHERILYFHDAFEKKNMVVIITELCYEDILERFTKKSNIMESEVRNCIRQILEGLVYLHQNDIIHLDIKPENILMVDQNNDQIRICDFGSAIKLCTNEMQYYKYGTPEFVAPEIVNQTPVSKATDIWPVGVITYLCLTGVSPFAAENDRASLLNIRNYNVAFEERMFADLCREAKGFVIKLLVADRLRPEAAECLRHPWFKTLTKGKSISTTMQKQVLARRRWQRSLISYKSKMVMRSIPELLDDSCKHVSIAVARHLKEGLPPQSSSSDTDEDIDELPFIPMPLTAVFSGSRMSLTEIIGDENVTESVTSRQGNHHVEELMECEPSASSKLKEHEELKERDNSKESLQIGSNVETNKSQVKSRRPLMRRGSSADSALLFHVAHQEEQASEEGSRILKKAMSMDLPRRSPSSNPGRSQEDYALKLELMRRRLLSGCSANKKLTGLRGPLLETLGVDDRCRTSSLDRNLRRSRLGATGLTPSESFDSGDEDSPKIKAFHKSVSFFKGNPESIPLHRKSGVPLEIPNTLNNQNIQEVISVSALPQQLGCSHGTHEAPLTVEDWQGKKLHLQTITHRKYVEPESVSEVSESAYSSNESEEKQENESSRLHSTDRTSAYADVMQIMVDSYLPQNGKQCHTPKIPTGQTHSYPETAVLPEHPAVFSKVATHQPVLRTDIKNIDSEDVFEAKFKKRESSLTRGLKRLTRVKSEEKTPVLSRRSGEEIYRPGPSGAPIELVSRKLNEKSKSVHDLREIETEKSAASTENGEVDQSKEQVKIESSNSKRRVSWALGRSKSLEKKGSVVVQMDQEIELRNTDSGHKNVKKSPVLAMRHTFESKVAGISEKIRSLSEDRHERKAFNIVESTERPNWEEINTHKKMTESPVLAMRKKFESKVGAISLRRHSQSEKGGGGNEVNPEGGKTPLLSQHRHSQSKGTRLKMMDITENILSLQTTKLEPKELEDSNKIIHKSFYQTIPESGRRSRWDRWGLSKSKRNKTPSHSDFVSKEKDSVDPQYSQPPSDFPPVFHVNLKDHLLLEGDPVTLSCLPAANPEPKILWMKDKKPLEIDDRMNLTSSADGRQLLIVLKTTKKDAGLYECVANNPLGSVSSSCTISLASVPKRPGTPEVPQIYNNSILVLWKPVDTSAPCTYLLERNKDGESTWLIVASGISDCYYNVTDIPSGTFQFRVACVNKAGQGPYSNLSEKVFLNTSVRTTKHPALEPARSPSGFVSAVGGNSRDQHSKCVSSDCPSSPSDTPSNVLSLHPKSPITQAEGHSTANSKPVAFTTDRQREQPSEGPATLPLPTQSLPAKNSAPPLSLPKPKCPGNVGSPITQNPAVRSSLQVAKPSSPSAPIKSATAIDSVRSTQVGCTSLSAPVVLVSSISPIGEGAACKTTIPSSEPTETVLRQGVPQKPYTFNDEKARGRFGVVRECRENVTGKMFMAKIVPYDILNKQEILQEYEILKSLHNNRIMALHEAYVTPRYLVLITECCAGKEILYSLSDRFHYSEDDVVRYLVQILQGLQYIHNHQILHLDIKPDNIMVTNLNIIKIIDFGSAQIYSPLSLKPCNRDLGRLEFSAPEVLRGDMVGPPADLWSFGVLTYVMLSGRFPFQEKDLVQADNKIEVVKLDPAKLYPNVSQSAFTFLKKILSSYPWSRPTTKECFTLGWLQDSYLMKLKRQTITFTTARLKEFLGNYHIHRAESVTKHKVFLRAYQCGPQPLASTTSDTPTAPIN
ncbi:striated muscle preferentially expressed protein kinase isoform X3 [Denticeps clupeoides]|uniref:striated muscle preferentially expressed protein kinase isoform X3 n=1 Tax=Denticeps clupeoides TaxID=299321 RepID=UPI0010A3AB80|nr:striated muscle preferentially expressed protein kinase-like isoform X3 [Denticeps clupeoides]